MPRYLGAILYIRLKGFIEPDSPLSITISPKNDIFLSFPATSTIVAPVSPAPSFSVSFVPVNTLAKPGAPEGYSSLSSA